MLVLFAAMRERLVVADIPEPFQRRCDWDDCCRSRVPGLHGLCGLSLMLDLLMDSPILLALTAIVGMGVVFGSLLGFASVKFEVEGNLLSDQINSICPRRNAASAVTRLSPYAEAIADGDAINKCPRAARTPSKRSRIYSMSNPNHSMPSTVPRRRWSLTSEKRNASVALNAFRPAPSMRSWRGEVMYTVIADECTGCDLCIVSLPGRLYRPKEDGHPPLVVAITEPITRSSDRFDRPVGGRGDRFTTSMAVSTRPSAKSYRARAMSLKGARSTSTAAHSAHRGSGQSVVSVGDRCSGR